MKYKALIAIALGFSSVWFQPWAFAQTTNNIDSPNNSSSEANPNVDLNQNGALVNTQVNNNPLGRSVVGNGVADCTSAGLALSTFGSAVGPFDSGSFGGSLSYTQSFGMSTCKEYAKNQLAKSKLETCLTIISNYSKISKAGIQISYLDLQRLAGVSCPAVTLPGSSVPSSPSFTPNPVSATPAPAQPAFNPSSANTFGSPASQSVPAASPRTVQTFGPPIPASQPATSTPTVQTFGP